MSIIVMGLHNASIIIQPGKWKGAHLSDCDITLMLNETSWYGSVNIVESFFGVSPITKSSSLQLVVDSSTERKDNEAFQ